MKKKKDHNKKSASGITQSKSRSPAKLEFSFMLFDKSDGEVCPATFDNGYVQALAEKLKNLAGWTPQEFLSERSESLKCHPVEWNGTDRPKGFRSLPTQFQSCIPYQFAVTRNKHGRVFGVMVEHTFYIVWLDCNHAVYS